MTDFIDSNQIIYKYQFGFRQGHSTQQAIISLVEKITRSLDSRDIVIGIFLDLKKAFDTVYHRILIRKLYFKHTNIDEVNVLLSKMNKTTCMFDPFPTRLLLDFSHLFSDVIVRIFNLTFSTASFPVAFKSAVVKPFFKKNTLDCDILKNFRPVSNLPYLSKLIEKVIAI